MTETVTVSSHPATTTKTLQVEELIFAFGDVILQFHSDDTEWTGYLNERYPRFALEGATQGPIFSIHFESTGPRPASLRSPLEAVIENVRTRPTLSGFDVESPTIHASVDLGAGRARLRGPRAMYPLDNLLRHLLPVLWERGVLFHGAALADGDNGLLACGPSGAGKSTLARLLGPKALCDELAGTRREGERAHRVVSLPFWASRPGEARLSVLLLLEHAEDHRLTALSPGQALRAASQLVLWPVASATAMERTLDHVAHLAASVPAYRLGFAPRESLWPFLAKELL